MTKNIKEPKSKALKALIATEGIFAFMGFASGFVLLFSPSGKVMGVSHLLKNAPVGDFTLVGLFFVAFYGVLPALAAYGLWTQKRWRWTDVLNEWTGQHWAWTASAALGIILIIWIAVEVILLGFLDGIGGVLQVVMAGLGLFVLALVMLPSVRSSTKLEA
jgi:hypothetical protein